LNGRKLLVSVMWTTAGSRYSATVSLFKNTLLCEVTTESLERFNVHSPPQFGS
jgi:hypothetical protein